MANTESKEVNLLKRIKTENDWYFFPVALTAKGLVRSDVVLVHGAEERHPEGKYYIEFREDGKRIRLPVGKDAEEAHNRRLAKEAEFADRNAGVPVLAQTNGNRISMSTAIAAYLEETKLTKKPKTYAAYSKALAYFEESAGGSILLAQINRTHLINFRGFLRDEKELSARSVYNKFESVISFLKAQGREKLVTKNDWPRFVEEEPEIYEREDIEKLFAACTSDEKLWFQFFLMTGMREQEVMYAYWSDLNLHNHTIRITHKPDRDWTPKAYKEREIPIPQPLVDALKAHKAKSDRKCNLIFPTLGCKPKLDFLDCLKRAASRAKMTVPCYLHKFRATFATWHLWAGVDLRTVQSWMGHSDLESTMRYLKPNRTQAVREKVNVTFGGVQ